jgi:hypothetical protein
MKAGDSTDPSKRRWIRRLVAVLGVALVAAALVIVSSYHSATLGLTVSNGEPYPVQIVLSVNGAVVFNQTLDGGASWSGSHALNWFAPVNPWSCESVKIAGHTNPGLPPINDTLSICSGQPVSVAFSAGGKG